MPQIVKFVGSISVNFNRDYKDVNDITIEELLKKYLSETNSKISLNPEDITFMFGNKILNKYPNILKTKVGDYRWRNEMPTIKVIDNSDILGGNNLPTNFLKIGGLIKKKYVHLSL